MALTNAEVDAAIPVAGTPSRTLTNAAVKQLITDVSGKADYFAPRSETGTSFSITAANHANRRVDAANAAAITATLNADAQFTLGDAFEIHQTGAGAITLAAGTATFTLSDNVYEAKTQRVGDWFRLEYQGGDAWRVTAASAPTAKWGGLEAFGNSGFGFIMPTALATASAPVFARTPQFNQQDSCFTNGSSSSSDASGNLIRTRYRSASAAVNRVAGIISPTPYYTNGTDRLNGGFPLVMECGSADANPANGSFFLGLYASVTANFTATEPTAQTLDMVGFGWDSTGGVSANGFLMHNDNAGAPTTIDLGATNFPRTQGYIYRICIDKNAAGTQLYVKVVNMVTQAESAVYTLTSNIPRTTAGLYLQSQRSSMSTAFQADIDFAGLYHGRLV